MGELENRIDKEVRAEFTERNIEIKKSEGEITDREEKFRYNFENLERRYKSKKRQLREEQAGIDNDKSKELENGWTEETVRARFESDRERLRVEFEKISKEFGQLIRAREDSISKLVQEQEELAEFHRKLEAEELDSLTRRKNEIKERIGKQYRDRKEKLSEAYSDEERIIARLRSEKETLSRTFGKLEEEEQQRFKREEAKEDPTEESIFDELLKELRDSPDRPPKRFKFIFEAEQVGPR